VEALRQVRKSVHSDHEGKRDFATLYVGDLEYNVSEQDLREALDPVFQKIRVEKITIPRVNCQSLYAFIDLFSQSMLSCCN
jgi:RNA recognition motif-containing protein